LQALARRGVRDFYEGELAEKILAFARVTGGLFSAGDLAAHTSRWVEPLNIDYQGYQVWELPPNGQGLAALLGLAILAGTDLGGHDYLSENSLHLQIEAMKLAFADAYRYIADPEQGDVPVAGLLDPAYIAGRRALIGPEARLPEPGQPPAGGTVYLAAVDRDGMMVSYIQSNYEGFGSGVVVPETGITLQNRGACFTLEAGHPNEAAGGKRPFHTIIPGFLTNGSRPVGPFGVMGGQMQPQGHLQVISAMLDYGLNPQAALDAPRWRVMAGLDVWLEPGLPGPVLAGLAGRGHAVTLQPDPGIFGRGQIIWRLESGIYTAGSDGRGDGAAVGW
jgi:gamma-glutamyltranspeptidase/glutathione hydrolase